MTHNSLRILSIAVNYNRMGFCFFVGKQPMDWQLVFEAAKSASKAEAQIRKWLEYYSPDIVITEDPKTLRRKGDRTKMLLDILNRIIQKTDVQHIEAGRVQPYKNRYDQIEKFCEKYPQLKAISPKRPQFFQKEPPYVTLFDAVSMAETVFTE